MWHPRIHAYVRKKHFEKVGTPEIRELREVNAKLKRVVADLTADRAVLQPLTVSAHEHTVWKFSERRLAQAST